MDKCGSGGDGRKPNDHNRNEKKNKNCNRKPVNQRKKNDSNQPSKSNDQDDLVEGINTNLTFGAVGGSDSGGSGSSGNGKKKANRIHGNAEDAITELSNRMGIKLSNAPTEYCLRPNFKSGTEGKKVKIRTNFFRMNIKGNNVYRYEVTFENSTIKNENDDGQISRRLTKKLNQHLLATFVKTTTGHELFSSIGLNYGYDNSQLLITHKPIGNLPEEGQTFPFQFREFQDGELRVIDITIKPTKPLSLTFDSSPNTNVEQNRAVLQVLDIISKSDAFRNHIVYGTKIFVSEILRRRIDMQVQSRQRTPYELAFGYHQSTRLCQGGVMQNIDRATVVLFKGGPLINTMFDLLGLEIEKFELSEWQHDALKELSHLRVETNYRPYKCRQTIKSFTRSPCNRTFFNDQGVDVSVYDYFRRQYPQVRLQYPHLPCVIYSPGKYIPIEVCTLLPDQRSQRKLREDLLKIVSEHTTRQKPADREREIVEHASQVSNQNVLGQFNIELTPEQVTVQSRILNPPCLQYGNGFKFTPQNGDWQMSQNHRQANSQQKTFFQPIDITRWVLFTLSSKIDKQIGETFVRHLQRAGEALGMKVENTLYPYVYLNSKKLENMFKDCSAQNLQLIVIIMPKSDDYYRIKSLGDRCHGIPTQVISDRHYDNRALSADRNSRAPRGQKLFDGAYLSNLLLKINAKLGGTNTKLSEITTNPCSILNKKTMVVGIDVNHPSPGEHTPSIAAVVGSIDQEFSKYRTVIHVNQERLEIVKVDQLIEPILEAFKEVQGYYPGHIIVYRDGVGEGQFPTVMFDEMNPLREKLENFGSPMLTYIIVQKRHSTRFFPINKWEGTKSENISPGSVIDTDICHYKWFDFYLCSQNSFLGTARPGKYTVLWNSSPAQADDLQKATYYLCYLFARATKSISDPAPARYAHHAAARGKVHLTEILLNELEANYETINERLNTSINVNDNLRNILYFI